MGQFLVKDIGVKSEVGQVMHLTWNENESYVSLQSSLKRSHNSTLVFTYIVLEQQSVTPTGSGMTEIGTKNLEVLVLDNTCATWKDEAGSSLVRDSVYASLQM